MLQQLGRVCDCLSHPQFIDTKYQTNDASRQRQTAHQCATRISLKCQYKGQQRGSYQIDKNPAEVDYLIRIGSPVMPVQCHQTRQQLQN